ncbi:hypothetical protein GU926_02060 [Nibribacter ruber]|uniref:Uncharacterized protein n=1 Tax=Nibribacter ruber TaxID=2698458 RepID=A0A6P1NTB9_9BACT|nr:hypothetical protein [Nibribacter ruber]QHL86290.1 hypothetical protein GU926_02060 [Nibribacter ruber]
MKKFLLSAMFVGAVLTAQAQTNLTGTAATTRAVLSMSATEMARQMYNDLKLNEGQYIKVKALNQTRIDRYSEVERMYSNDPQMRDSKIREIDSQLDEEFAEILTPKQFTAYLEMGGKPTSTSTLPAESSTPSTTTMDSSAGSTISTSSSTSANMGTTATDSTNRNGNVTKYKKGDMEQKVKKDEMKMKEGDHKVKSEAGKFKVEDGDNKTKIESDKMKMESAHGEMKIKEGEEKLKTDSVRYKSDGKETKIITPAGKTKIEPNKVKTKTATTKKKVKN